MGNYNHNQYASGQVYPLQNPISKGYAVAEPGVNPKGRESNGTMTNQKGEEIDFWIEEIEANFSMTGSIAQSRNVRQFMPHNVVQPTIMIKGRAPNQFQLNRMASFVRSSHYNSLHTGEQIRETVTNGGKESVVETVRLLIRNGETPRVWNADRDHKRVKGVHVPWQVEGYIKAMKAGGQRFNPAPPFEFEFFVAESKFKQGNVNMGMWEDLRVYGAELKPWLDWIKKSGEFVTVDSHNSRQKEQSNPTTQTEHGHDDPGSSSFDEPATPEPEFSNPFKIEPLGGE